MRSDFPIEIRVKKSQSSHEENQFTAGTAGIISVNTLNDGEFSPPLAVKWSFSDEP